MLHIILLILKILGFLILVLAGLMLVAVITVLFAPAGYRFDLTAEEFGKSILGKLRFYWIKPFISGEICYDNGNLTWNIRAAWKKFGNAEIQGNDKDKKNIRNEAILYLGGAKRKQLLTINVIYNGLICIVSLIISIAGSLIFYNAGLFSKTVITFVWKPITICLIVCAVYILVSCIISCIILTPKALKKAIILSEE